MSYLGTVKNGVVVLEDAAALGEGTVVRVELIEHEHVEPSLGDRLAEFSGILDGLPSDFARNHDHYIHGTERQ